MEDASHINLCNQILYWRVQINKKNRKFEDFIQTIHNAENAAVINGFDPDLLVCSNEKFDKFKCTKVFVYGAD